jgi:hypothetical protein
MSAFTLLWNPMVSASVGALFSGIVAPIVVNLIEGQLDSRGFSSITADRKAKLSGIWLGEGEDVFTEALGVPKIPFTVTVAFSVKGKKVEGKARIRPRTPAVPNVALNLSGGFYDSDFLQLTYKSTVLRRKAARSPSEN